DGSDMRWAMIEEDIPIDEFREMYKGKTSANATTEAWVGIGNDAPNWASGTGEVVRVVEYYELVHVPITIRLGSDGRGYATDEKMPKGVKPVKDKERKSFRKEVRWWKLNAMEIL